MSALLLRIIFDQPITPFALSLSLCALALGFTSQTSPLRATGLVPMLGCMQLATRTVHMKDDTTHQLYMSMIMGSTASMVMQYLDSVLLSRWTYEAQGPTSAIGGQTNIRMNRDSTKHDEKSRIDILMRRLAFGWKETFRARSPRTPWEVNHVPKFFPDRPNMVPTKSQFLYWTARRGLISLFIVDVISFMGRDASQNSVNFASTRIPFFARLPTVTTQEFVLRLISSVLHWVVFVYLLQAIYDITAVILIAFRFGRIENWPPLFNHWTECWSIRQFWGSFWHQGARQKFLAPANFLSFSVLQLTKGTLLARYVVLSLTFAISGCFHQFGDVASGVPWHEAGAAKFFVMQAAGIMIEDMVQGAFRWFQKEKRTADRPSGWKRIIGFIWLLIWLTWTTPGWVYPVAQRSSGKPILPFSPLEWLT